MAFAYAPAKDPESLAAAAVVGRFCSEVWNAALDPAFRDPAGTTLGALASGVASYLKASPSAPRHVAGPISALHKSLDKAKWSFFSPVVLASADGNHLHLLTICPKRIVKAFKEDLRKTVVARYATKLQVQFATPEADRLVSDGIFTEPLFALYNTMAYKQANTLLKITSNGIFTDFDLLCAGYDIDSTCRSCGNSHDTVFHRCYSCPAIASRAISALGQELYDTIIAAGDNSLMSTRCLFANPPIASRPSTSTVFENALI